MKFLRISLVTILLIWLVLATYLSFLFLREVSSHELYVLPPFTVIPTEPSEKIITGIEFGDLDKPFYQRITPLINEDWIEIIQISYLEPVDSPHDNLPLRFKEKFDLWPESLQKFTNDHVYQVLIVKGLQSSAQVVRLDHEKFYLILVNELVLSESPNDWATRVEETIFNYESVDENLSLIIENENDPILTLENILLHEIGHIVGDIHGGLSPTWHETEISSLLPFFNKTFQVDYVEFSRRQEEDEIFDALNYYDLNGIRIRFSDYYYLAENLGKTSYPTMYSTQNESELFAEMFYSYVHCVIQKKPYQMTLSKGSGNITLNNGINETRSEYERKFIENLFVLY